MHREYDLLFVHDRSYCGYPLATRANCPNISAEFLQADYTAKLPAIAGTASLLNDAGIWPILSTKNYFNASYDGLSPGIKHTCILPLDAYAAALSQTGWVRFEEFWLNNGDKDYNALQIDTALRLADSGVPLIAHSETFNGNCSAVNLSHVKRIETAPPLRGYSDSASGPVDLAFALAGFLIVQSPYSYFGVSSPSMPWEQCE